MRLVIFWISVEMQEKLSGILKMLVKVAMRTLNIEISRIQSILHDWRDPEELVDMIDQITRIIESSPSTLTTLPSSLEQQLQKQEGINRQNVRKELFLNQKVRLLEEEMEQLRGEYEKKVVELKMQETRNGDLKYELAKTTKSYSLELGEKELLINKLETNINLINQDRWGKTQKERDKLFGDRDKEKDREKGKKPTRHKRGRSDDPILKKDRYLHMR